MSDDLEMIRGEIPGGFNLALGEPVVVQEELGSLGAYSTRGLDWGPWHYPDLFGHPKLLEQVRLTQPWAKHIVIGNGAKQCLSAAMYAYLNRYKSYVHHTAPYWPSYKTLANELRYGFVTDTGPRLSSEVLCISAPNNPDGGIDQRLYVGGCNILDCAYDSPMYRSALDHSKAKADIKVYSAAKLFGAPGLRIGWLTTDDEELAQRARHYIEITTSGVSLFSQEMVARLAFFSTGQGFADCVGRVRAKMEANSDNMRELIGSHLLFIGGVAGYAGSGMFAWVKPNDYEHFTSALEAAKVAVVSGKACGTPGWYRINMAHNTEYTAKALQALAKELNK